MGRTKSATYAKKRRRRNPIPSAKAALEAEVAKMEALLASPKAQELPPRVLQIVLYTLEARKDALRRLPLGVPRALPAPPPPVAPPAAPAARGQARISLRHGTGFRRHHAGDDSVLSKFVLGDAGQKNKWRDVTVGFREELISAGQLPLGAAGYDQRTQEYFFPANVAGMLQQHYENNGFQVELVGAFGPINGGWGPLPVAPAMPPAAIGPVPPVAPVLPPAVPLPPGVVVPDLIPESDPALAPVVPPPGTPKSETLQPFVGANVTIVGVAATRFEDFGGTGGHRMKVQKILWQFLKPVGLLGRHAGIDFWVEGLKLVGGKERYNGWEVYFDPSQAKISFDALISAGAPGDRILVSPLVQAWIDNPPPAIENHWHYYVELDERSSLRRKVPIACIRPRARPSDALRVEARAILQQHGADRPPRGCLPLRKIGKLILDLGEKGLLVGVSPSVARAINEAQAAKVEPRWKLHVDKRASFLRGRTTGIAKVDKILAQMKAGGGLYPYQIEGVRWLWNNQRAILADEMGLGKTIQAAVAIPPGAGVLIVCPVNLKGETQKLQKKRPLDPIYRLDPDRPKRMKGDPAPLYYIGGDPANGPGIPNKQVRTAPGAIKVGAKWLPPPMPGVWEREISKWRPDLGPFTVIEDAKDFRWPRPNEVVITNPEKLPPRGLVNHKNESEPGNKFGGHGMAKNKNNFNFYGWGKMWKDYIEAHPCPPGCVLIVDEGHSLKSGSTWRAKGAIRAFRGAMIGQEFARRGGWFWELTATPLLNKPSEIWNMIENFGEDYVKHIFAYDSAKGDEDHLADIEARGYEGRQWARKARDNPKENFFFMMGGQKPNVFLGDRMRLIAPRGQAARRLSAALGGPMLRRRLKPWLSLKGKTTQEVLLTMDDLRGVKLNLVEGLQGLLQADKQEGGAALAGEQNIGALAAQMADEALKAVDYNLEDAIDLAEKAKKGRLGKLISRFRMALAIAKVPAMLDWVQRMEDAGLPCVVFSAHKIPIKVLEKRPGWAAIYGGIGGGLRSFYVQQFQEGKLKGIAGTIGAMAEGITLTHSTQMLFVDRAWTPAMNDQAEARIYRIGQDKDVVIHSIVLDHPLDRRVISLTTSKQILIDHVINAAAVMPGDTGFPGHRVGPPTPDPVVAPPIPANALSVAMLVDEEHGPIAQQGRRLREAGAATHNRLREEQRARRGNRRRARDNAIREHRQRMERIKRLADERRLAHRLRIAAQGAGAPPPQQPPPKGWQPVNAADAAEIGLRGPRGPEEVAAGQVIGIVADYDPDHAAQKNHVGFAANDQVGHALAWAFRAQEPMAEDEWKQIRALGRKYHNQVVELAAGKR